MSTIVIVFEKDNKVSEYERKQLTRELNLSASGTVPSGVRFWFELK